MKVKNLIFQAIFLALVIYQTYVIAIFDQSTQALTLQVQNSSPMVNLIFIKLDFFVLISFVAALCLLPPFGKLKDEVGQIRRFIQIIFAYVLYQIIIIAPLSYLDGLISITGLAQAILFRMTILLIPFFLWFVLPRFKKIERVFSLINLSSLVLLAIAVINYNRGNYLLTNTGQIRLLWGGAVLIFAMVFFTNFFHKKKQFVHYFYIIASLLGVVFTNHRSAYIPLFLVILVGIWLFDQTRSRLKTATISLLIILSALFIFAQNGLIWENFTKRLASTNLQDENLQERIRGWQLSYEHFKDSPINGSMLKDEYYRPIHYDQMQPHGFIFELLPTQGIIGLLFYLYLLSHALIVAYKNRRDEVSLQMFLSLLFYILYSMFNVCLLNTWNMLILILAVSAILYRDKKICAESSSIRVV